MKQQFSILSSMRSIIIFSATILFASSCAVADGSLTEALSARHFNQSTADLEAKYGGEEKLVAELLQLRKQESPPFVGVRAAKILMSYSGREDVAKAMYEDIQSDDTVGLAQLYAINIDKISNESTRRRLARALVDRSKGNARVATAVESMQSSSDAEVSRLAKGSL
jgi:hypothetical protein